MVQSVGIELWALRTGLRAVRHLGIGTHVIQWSGDHGQRDRPRAGTVLAGVGEIPALEGRDGAHDQPHEHHYSYVPRHGVSPWVFGRVTAGGRVLTWVAASPGDSECTCSYPRRDWARCWS